LLEAEFKLDYSSTSESDVGPVGELVIDNSDRDRISNILKQKKIDWKGVCCQSTGRPGKSSLYAYVANAVQERVISLTADRTSTAMTRKALSKIRSA
jgi:hypothetical protein